MMKKTLAALLAATLLTLAGCGGGLEGSYGTAAASYTFKRNGTVVVDTFGGKVELEYERDGQDIRIKAPQGTLILRLVDEDTIEGPMGVKLRKQK